MSVGVTLQPITDTSASGTCERILGSKQLKGANENQRRRDFLLLEHQELRRVHIDTLNACDPLSPLLSLPAHFVSVPETQPYF